jgi:hypothetical protein
LLLRPPTHAAATAFFPAAAMALAVMAMAVIRYHFRTTIAAIAGGDDAARRAARAHIPWVIPR